MAVALIVAAGRGERLGCGGPKALATLAGRPMLDWSVAALAAVAEVRRIIVALPAGRLDAAPEGTVGVTGGATRSQSVLAALKAAGAADVVVVHDAARPLAGPQLFRDAIALLESSGADAVVTAAPVSDTIKRAQRERDPGCGPGLTVGLRVLETLDRAALWAVQTPQVFRRGALERALSAPAELLASATDDASLIERDGGSVRLLPSSAENFKITTQLDLRLAELMLSERHAR